VVRQEGERGGTFRGRFEEGRLHQHPHRPVLVQPREAVVVEERVAGRSGGKWGALFLPVGREEGREEGREGGELGGGGGGKGGG